MGLTELCQELRNWFEREKFFGEFTIENGAIIVPDGSLQDGQFFRVIGSVFLQLLNYRNVLQHG